MVEKYTLCIFPTLQASQESKIFLSLIVLKDEHDWITWFKTLELDGLTFDVIQKYLTNTEIYIRNFCKMQAGIFILKITINN